MGPGSPVVPDLSVCGWPGLCWVCLGISMSFLSQQIPSVSTLAPRDCFGGGKVLARRYVPQGTGEHSSPVEAGMRTHSQDGWEPPSVDQQQVGSDGDTLMGTGRRHQCVARRVWQQCPLQRVL